MNFHATSGLLVGLAATISGLLVYLHNPLHSKNRAYSLYCLSASVWGYAYLAWQLTEDHDSALFFVRLLMGGAIFLPTTYLYHVLTIVDLVERRTVLLTIGWILSGVFLLSDWTPFFVRDVRPALTFPFWPQPGFLFHAYLLWFACASGYGTFLLYRASQKAEGVQQRRLRLLIVGSLIAHAGGFTTFPLWYGIAMPPIGTILITAYPSVVAYALLRYRLLDFGETVEKGVTYGILLSLIVLPSFPVLLLVQQLYFGFTDHGYALVELVMLMVLVFCFSAFRLEVQNMISKTLFKERYDLHHTVTDFSKSLVTILDLKTLCETILHSIGKLMGIGSGIVYLFDKDTNGYRPFSSFGVAIDSYVPVSKDLERDLFGYATQGHPCLIRQELEEESPERSLLVLKFLHTLNAELCLLLSGKTKLLGMLFFGRKKAGELYSFQERQSLATLSQEAAIALENAILYEELKRSQALIRRTDRLRSLETMAGGLAHEIRNPLTSIKTFIELTPERLDDDEFLVTFGKVVKDDVLRIERLTQEILDYARPFDPVFQLEDINAIIESCLYIIRIRPTNTLLTIETELAHSVSPVYVDAQQIKQVLLNLFLNAVEAMIEIEGTLMVRTSSVAKNEDSHWVQIEVQDTGHGIPQEDLDHIFDPFFTTKHTSQEREGTGLGLAIVHQIIQEHQGYVEVKSQLHQGTSFVVHLPVSTPPLSFSQPSEFEGESNPSRPSPSP